MRIGRILVATLAAMACSGPVQHTTAQAQFTPPVRFDILFDDNCDGMNLLLGSGGGAIGTHTGCNAGEFVQGQQFTSGDETGVSVMLFERASGSFVRYDIYRTGFRAGRFYVYQVRNDTLLRYSTYSPAP